MDPTLELQGAIIARLRADATLAAIVGKTTGGTVKVFDNAPSGTTEPYVSIGPTSFQQEDADCIEGGEVMFQIDAWSTGDGNSVGASTQVRKMADAIRRALHRHEFALVQNAVVMFEHWRTDYLRNGQDTHASVRFTGFVETP